MGQTGKSQGLVSEPGGLGEVSGTTEVAGSGSELLQQPAQPGARRAGSAQGPGAGTYRRRRPAGMRAPGQHSWRQEEAVRRQARLHSAGSTAGAITAETWTGGADRLPPVKG